MNDQEFLAAFEATKLADEEFHHRDHIRMAWMYLRRDEWEVALRNIKEGIHRFAAAHHVPTLYHETITVFWAHMVLHAIQQTPDLDDFAAFEGAHPYLFASNLIHSYYSRDLLSTDAARSTMVEPDQQPLPSANI